MNAFKNHTTTTATAQPVPADQVIASLVNELGAAGAILATLHHFSSTAPLSHAMADLKQRGVIDQDLLRSPERCAVLSMSKQYLSQRAEQAAHTPCSGISRDLVRRLRTVAGQSRIKPPALDLEAADHIEKQQQRIIELERSAQRTGKLLQFCTEAKPKFGPDGKIRSMTMTFKTSVETSYGYRDELCKLIDEMKPTYRDIAHIALPQDD